MAHYPLCGKKHWDAQAHVIYRNKKDYEVLVSHIDSRKTISIFRYHFFERFAERFGIEYETQEELVAKFFIRNIFYKRNKCNEATTFSLRDGIGLGYYTPKDDVDYLNTFLTIEMLYENQLDVHHDCMLELQNDIESKKDVDQIVLRTSFFSTRQAC